MDLRSLSWFVAIAEERGFSAAARRLCVSQPALSQRVRLLERRLGTRLVDRSARPIALTPSGLVLLDGAYRILKTIEDVEAEVRAGTTLRGSELRIGVVYGGLYGLLASAVARVRGSTPAARLPVRQLRGPEQLTALRRGDVDVVVYRTTHAARLDDFAHVPLLDDPLVAALPAGHPRATDGVVRLADLAAERFVMLRRSAMPMVYDRIIGACRAAGFEPAVVTEIDDPYALAVGVASGLGVALSGAGMADRYPGVEYLPVTPRTTIARIVAVWRRGYESPLLDAFVGALRSATA